MRLPDPFTPNLQVDMLAEIRQPPRVLSDYTTSLKITLKRDVDNYLKLREQQTQQQVGQAAVFLQNLSEILAIDPNNHDLYSGGTKYNVPMINSLVLYVGIAGIAQLQASDATSSEGDDGKDAKGKSGDNQQDSTLSSSDGPLRIAQTGSMDIFQRLLTDLDSEGRYLFLGAIANQLRYPNSHTHYFSQVLFFLFHESEQEVMKEQITRYRLALLSIFCAYLFFCICVANLFYTVCFQGASGASNCEPTSSLGTVDHVH